MNNLKLNKLNSHRLNKQALASIKGGTGCGCGCSYAGSGGGSSTSANGMANANGGLNSANPTCYWLPEVIVTPSVAVTPEYTERVPGNYLME